MPFSPIRYLALSELKQPFFSSLPGLHKSRPAKSTFKRGVEGKKVSVFASRTPDRLSRISIWDARLGRGEDTYCSRVGRH